jgi:hypothetical protein
MKKSFILFLTITTVFLSSCAKIYYSPDAVERAAAHKIIAITPPKVSIAARKKVDAEAMREQQKTESANFQQEMFSWMLKRKMQNKIHVEIQDVATTNAKLTKAGYFGDAVMTPAEINEVLGVDAIITSNYALSKPMSEAGAVVVGVLFGAWGSTNETQVSLELHDAKTKKMLWNYNHKASGSIGSSPSRLVDDLMRHASKKMPYAKVK